MAETKLAKARRKSKVDGAKADEIRDIKNKNLDSIPEKVKAGRLDPTAFNVSDLEAIRPMAAETDRIEFLLLRLLNKHYSRQGAYEWQVGFYSPGDPAANGAGGWHPLLTSEIFEHWTDEFKTTVGLHEFEGAVCWAGRGRMDRHVICVRTTDLRDKMRQIHNIRVQEQFSEIEAPPGSDGVQLTETKVKANLNFDPTANID